MTKGTKGTKGTEVTEEEQQERIDMFLAYAENLFNMPIAPEPCSMKFVEIDLNDEQQTGILYDLFSFGFRKKLEILKASNEPFKIQLAQDPEQLFTHVADFVKASGYEPVLNDVVRNDKNEIINLDIIFRTCV